MEDQIFGILALVIFGLPFVVLAVKARQKMTPAPGRQPQPLATPGSSEDAGADSRAEESTDPLRRIEAIFPTLDRAAGEFLRLQGGADLRENLRLAAGMAGLKMLRNSGASLDRLVPGQMLVGAIPDEAYEDMQRFLLTCSLSNGLQVEGFGRVQIPAEDKAYLPGISRLEPYFDALCERHGVKTEDRPYAAALAALKLVVAGTRQQILDARTGQYMTYFHIVTASKTVPQLLSYADIC